MRRLLIGLGLLAGAVLPSLAGAQVPDSSRAKRDSAKVVLPARPTADTLLRGDSLKGAPDTLPPVKMPKTAAAPIDSIKAPIARAEAPRPVEVGGAYVWDRPALFAAGAMTLGDFVERLPGVTLLRAGWFSSPQTAADMGQPGRVRVFLDGLEMTPLNPRNGAALDLSHVPIFDLEEIRLERGAGEVRVYARSWRVDHTTPYTRADVMTGDQQTNAYRGYYGKRWNHGEVLQVGASQYGTTPDRSSSADLLGIMTRVGVARDRWSLDAFMVRSGVHRGDVVGFPDLNRRLHGEESSRTDAYVRAAWGDPDKGFWAQALASSSGFHLTGDSTNAPPPADSTQPRPKPDSTASQAQYMVTSGFAAGLGQVSGAARFYVRNGKTLLVPSARASTQLGFVTGSVFGEGKGTDSVSRVEASVAITPFDRVALLGSVGRASDASNGPSLTTTYLRGEAGVRVAHLWILGGVLRRDTAVAQRLTMFDSAYAAQALAPATALTLGVRGRIWRDVGAEAWALQWTDTAGLYRPRYQTRAEIYLRTRWLSRFPSGDFGLQLALTHEYRSGMRVPIQTANGANIDTVEGYRVVGSLLEIRILRAVAFWQFRNALGTIYHQIPGFAQPRQTQMYGVRWEFWD